jgi:hypothetical protein
MDDMASPQAGYSADVWLFLIALGTAIPLAQIGPDSVVLRDPIELPRCEAEILMVVDGEERRWPVVLPNGAVPFELEVSAESV